jgi:hypothetical protein
MHPDRSYPAPTPDYPYPEALPRRPDLAAEFVSAVTRALGMMFVDHLEVPYLWHYKRDTFSVLENSGRSSVQFLDRDDLWKLYALGIRFRAIYERNNATRTLWEKIKQRRETPELSHAEKYFEEKLLHSICMMSVEAAAEGSDWLAYHYVKEIKRIKEDETADEIVKKLPTKAGSDDIRSGPLMKLVQVSPTHALAGSRIDLLMGRHSVFLSQQWPQRSTTPMVFLYLLSMLSSCQMTSLPSLRVKEPCLPMARPRSRVSRILSLRDICAGPTLT